MLSGPDVLVILVIALFVFGPQKLPELARSLGKAMREFKKASEDRGAILTSEIRGNGRIKNDFENVINHLYDFSFSNQFSVHDDEGVVDYVWHFLVCRLFAAFPVLF